MGMNWWNLFQGEMNLMEDLIGDGSMDQLLMFGSRLGGLCSLGRMMLMG